MTGLEAVKVLSSAEDSLDRLLVSFKDAKVCFLLRRNNRPLKSR